MLGQMDAVHSGVALSFVTVLIVGLTIGSTMGALARACTTWASHGQRSDTVAFTRCLRPTSLFAIESSVQLASIDRFEVSFDSCLAFSRAAPEA